MSSVVDDVHAVRLKRPSNRQARSVATPGVDLRRSESGIELESSPSGIASGPVPSDFVAENTKSGPGAS